MKGQLPLPEKMWLSLTLLASVPQLTPLIVADLNPNKVVGQTSQIEAKPTSSDESPLWRGKARKAMGDFGVPIALVVMVAVSLSLGDVYTEKLDVPNGLKVTLTFPQN